MAYFYRLIFIFLCVFSLPSHALIPKIVGSSAVWSDNYATNPNLYSSPNSRCKALGFLDARNMTGVQGTSSERWQCWRMLGTTLMDSNYYIYDPVYQLICPSNSTASGNSCVCTLPYVENAGKTACELPPQNCSQGDVANFDYGLGWYPEGTSALTYIQAAPNASLCVQSGAYKCSTETPSFVSALIKKGLTANAVTLSLSAKLSGVECSGPVVQADVLTPPPACAGQTGTVNGLQVCIPNESDASKKERAANAASLAASAASAAASSAGASPAAAAAAGAAAGAAASNAVMGGASNASAASAGAAAGAASKAASDANKTPTESKADSSAAAASKAASDAASKAASDAGMSIAAAAAAAKAAGDAASKAASDAITSGASLSAAAAAAKAAGDAAAAEIARISKAAADAARDAAVAAGKTLAEQKAAADAARDAAAAAADSASKAAKAAADAAAAAKAKKDSEKENEKDDLSKFCEDNPKAQICKEAFDSKFSGSCDAPPSCEGDAIQCAVAAQTLKMSCLIEKLNEDSPESDLYEAEKDKDGSQTGDLPNNSDVSFSSSNFDTTNLLSGSCIADRSVTISGKTIIIPFSDVCQYLAMLGNLMLALSFLMAGRIVVRG